MIRSFSWMLHKDNENSMEHYQLVISGYEQDRLGIGNILKCLVTALSINDNTVIRCAPDYEYGTYDTLLDPKHIEHLRGNPDGKEQVRVYTCRFNLLYFEDAYQEDLPNEETTMDPIHPSLFHWYFSRTKRIDWHYDPAKVDPRVRNRIFEAIDKIKFLPAVHESAARWTRLFEHLPTLGISVRTWKASHELSVGRPYSMDIYTRRIAEVMTRHPDIQCIVLSVDKKEEAEPYMEHLQTEYPHCRILILQQNHTQNSIQYAMCKVFTLAKCKYFIGNRISTFSELVYWFGRCRPRVYTVY